MLSNQKGKGTKSTETIDDISIELHTFHFDKILKINLKRYQKFIQINKNYVIIYYVK